MNSHIYAISYESDAILVEIPQGSARQQDTVSIMGHNGNYRRYRGYIAGIFRYWRSLNAKIVRMV